MPRIQITLSDPVPDLKCLACGKVHQFYSDVREWGDCLVLEDTRFIPHAIWGCWCDENCFWEWYNSLKVNQLFDDTEEVVSEQS